MKEKKNISRHLQHAAANALGEKDLFRQILIAQNLREIVIVYYIRCLSVD